jgi:uncharacterized protein with HEPN domain
MNRDSPRLGDYLAHILEGINRIARYTDGMKASDFAADPLVQDAVIRNLEVIGEASHNIETQCPDFAAAHSQLPLGAAYQMRNAVAHGYFKVDLGIVWQTIQGDLGDFQAQIQQARDTLGLDSNLHRKP